MREEDFEAVYQAASDPLIWELHPEKERYQRDVFQKFFDAGIASNGAFVVIDKATGEIIGSSRYNDYDPNAKTIEIGFTFLARKYWGGKYNAEMKRLMLEHAFRDVDQVYFYVGETNWRSRGAMEKIGGKLLPTIEMKNPGTGVVASVVYVIRKEDYSHIT